MPRTLKGYDFLERCRDAWDEYQALKLYRGLYGDENIKVLAMQNQWGQPYTDIYLKKGAKKKRNLKARFGSHMNFEEEK